MLFVCAVILHAAGKHEISRSAPTIDLATARQVFPNAGRVHRYDTDQRANLVLDERNQPLGYILFTSPESDELIGYSGPSNLVIGVGLDGRIQRVQLVSSKDTRAHVEQVRSAEAFWRQFVGRSRDKLHEHVDAVSGSTLTSLAMAEGLERRLAGSVRSLRFAEPVSVAEVQTFFPQAASLAEDLPRPGWFQVLDDRGKPLGFVVRSSPQADNVIGYAGPTETLIAVDRDEQTVLAIQLRKSYDTGAYVERVKRDEQYLQSLAGRTIEQWSRINFTQEGIEGVSGATQTSFAIAEGIRRRLTKIASDQTASQASSWRPKFHELGLALIIVGAITIGFTHLKGNRRMRRVWQVVLMVGFGLALGDLLSLALLAGWAKNGIPWQSAPSLVLLVAVALLVPWSTRRQIYCHHLCPHGAAQEWLGRFRQLHVRLPERWHPWLAWLPYALLGIALALSVSVPRFDLSSLEPFDAWVLKQAAIVPAVIAVVGLIASLFVPMAYCRFGCPTGALLKMVRSHASEQFRWPDGIALVLIAICGAKVWMTSSTARQHVIAPEVAAANSQFSGRVFGTSWNVKFHTRVPQQLEQEIADELQRIERTLSHWSIESETSQFNSSGTTQAMEVSQELATLVSFGRQLSEKTDGAFDLTVAPLVDAWGFGPSGTRPAPPSDDTIAELLKRIGWQKLLVDLEASTLRKRQSGLTIDLGSLLQGYAADRVGELLDRRGIAEYLIEVGGELKARGAWQVAIENPSQPDQPLETFTLRDAALATSGIYRSRGHILDPRTGRPIESPWQLVAVIQPTCLAADGWATALLASTDVALDIANREGIPALLLDQSGHITRTSLWTANGNR